MNKESGWDYPRPPRVDTIPRRVKVVFAGALVADTSRAPRVLETSHPPTYYIPRTDVRLDLLVLSARHSFCEFKGQASYWTLKLGNRLSPNAAWSYTQPRPGFEAIEGHLAFYANRVDACFVGDEVVKSQDGDFYRGWITSDITGPFKGGPGRLGW